MRAARALKQPEVRLASLVDEGALTLDTRPGDEVLDVSSIETEFKYEGYLRRQEAAVERQRRHEARRIPDTFVFQGIPGLSREMAERLSAALPTTLGAAGRIPGITPAALAVLLVHARKLAIAA